MFWVISIGNLSGSLRSLVDGIVSFASVLGGGETGEPARGYHPLSTLSIQVEGNGYKKEKLYRNPSLSLWASCIQRA